MSSQATAASASAEARRAQAAALKDEGNNLAKLGRRQEAIAKYEKGIRFLGLPTYELDEEGFQALEQQTPEGRELLSVLASNAAQMYMSLEPKQLGVAIARASLALEAKPSNAKAAFRRATASLEQADRVAKGADALLARGQSDVRKFLQIEPGNAAGLQLQEQLARKRQALMGPLLRENVSRDAQKTPDWFEQVKDRAIFVSLCGSTATGRDQLDLPEALLSMATQAKDKKAISVGVAYVGYKGPDELEMFDEEWQKKYYRMLKLGERATKVPLPKQVVVNGEVYNVWSLLEGRVRVMRVGEYRKNGERVSHGWMRYCSQLLWHGEPFAYQSCRSYLRFAPRWDEFLKNDLAVALRRSPKGTKPVLSWMSRGQEEEPWQWVSEHIDYEDNCNVPSGTLVCNDIEDKTGWLRFRRRFFCHTFGVPAQVAFYSPHNSFSTSEILSEVPVDPFLNSLPLSAQFTCENIRLHTSGWEVFTPCANFTWETTHDSHAASQRLQGALDNAEPELLQAQLQRSSELLNPTSRRSPNVAFDTEAREAPLPTGIFWTTLCSDDPSPWTTIANSTSSAASGTKGGIFAKGTFRTLTDFENLTGVDFERKAISSRAMNGGLGSDRDFEDSQAEMEARERALAKLQQRH